MLASIHAALAVSASRENSTTVDELAHLTGGYTFNHYADFRLHPENGILPQRWQALPFSLTKVNYPALTSDWWQASIVWMVGHDFLFQSGNDPDRLLFWARAMNSLFGAALVLAVFFWSRRVWGEAGAWISAGFAAFCPTLLAHSGLATSDMCMAFFFVVVPTLFWWHLQEGSARSWAASAIALGLAVVAKHAAVLLLPVLGLLAVLRIARSTPWVFLGRPVQSRLGRTGAILGSSVAQGVVAIGIVWLFFGFRFSAFNPALPPGEPNIPWNEILDFGGWKASVIRFCRDAHLLPEGWLYGFSFVLAHAQGRAAFLDGQYSVAGWWDFFPRTFLYKTPPTLLIGLIAAITLIALRVREVPWRRALAGLYLTAPLLVLFVVYWLFSLTSHLNIGHRHILPTYAPLYVLAGALGWAATRARQHGERGGTLITALVALLLAWHAATTVRTYPHYLSYFNSIVGGPHEGYRHLVDSSLDWGQDLPALRRWVAENRRPGEPVYLSYFGSDEPARFVSDVTLLPCFPAFNRDRPWYTPAPGIYAVSATMLQHVYFPHLAQWSDAWEQRYQELRGHESVFRAHPKIPRLPSSSVPSATERGLEETGASFESLRFARLCQYLRARRVDAFAGDSILIFRLSSEELSAALDGDAKTLVQLLEKTSAP